MPDSKAVVEEVRSLSEYDREAAIEGGEPPLGTVRVAFASGRTGLLDTRSPREKVWAEVMESRREAGEPVYVEIEPETERIRELLIPIRVTAESIVPAEEGDADYVHLRVSAARHVLRHNHANYSEMRRTLEAAVGKPTVLLVTDSPDGEIIDVRVAAGGALVSVAAPSPEAAPPKPKGAAVTLTRAKELYRLVSAKTCCPASAPSPCIPFQYPNDGCWGRAHEMVRLMLADGAEPEKVWIYGNLHVISANKPDCNVYWGWHVAPTLNVKVGAASMKYVIDPSMFAEPVTQSTWVAAQNDASAQLAATTAAVFYRAKDGTLSYDDGNYTQTKSVLATYRGKLKVQASGKDGPPPYEPCLKKPTGVQWFGTLAGKTTQNWFTWGWPASWHVLWTVMPTTHCPGAPQLSWRVQVERADADKCTHWIRVTNLTADPVRFEGRFDVLSK